jgi:hypothetical protein
MTIVSPGDVERLLAIDWSGARTGAARKVWLAESRAGDPGRVVRLESGRDRAALLAHLLAESDRDPALVVGLDFSFSLPAWFLRAHGLSSAPELWSLAAREGERWLAACEPPFWGRPGRRRPVSAHDELRATEAAVGAVAGIRPKSTFQIGGAGAVGTGAIRGMPVLAALRDAGWAIWPFDAPVPGQPAAVEIWPRLLTGPVVKSRAGERAAYLARRYPSLAPAHRAAAASSEDAFDALVSAIVMAEHAGALARLEGASDERTRLEGAIWRPCSPERQALIKVRR